MEKKLFKCDEISVEDYDEDSNEGYILGVDCEYPKRLHNFNNDLLFLQKRIKIKKCHKLVCNLYNKNNYVNAHKKFKSDTALWINTKG